MKVSHDRSELVAFIRDLHLKPLERLLHPIPQTRRANARGDALQSFGEHRWNSFQTCGEHKARAWLLSKEKTGTGVQKQDSLFWQDVWTHVHSSDPPWVNQHCKNSPDASPRHELLQGFCNIPFWTLIISDKHKPCWPVMCQVNRTTCNGDKLILRFIVSPSVFPLTSQLWKSIALRERCLRYGFDVPQSVWFSLPPRHLFYLDDSKDRFTETIRRKGTNPLTAAQVILFVVRMWLKHHLLGRQILYCGQRGCWPVFLERFHLRKKQSRLSSNIQTLRRLIRDGVKVSWQWSLPTQVKPCTFWKPSQDIHIW